MKKTRSRKSRDTVPLSKVKYTKTAKFLIVFWTVIEHLIPKECGFPVGHSKINSEEIREFVQIIFKNRKYVLGALIDNP